MATYWVDNVTGNNGDTGGELDPWQTINHAEGQLGVGDVLNVVNTGVSYTTGFNAVVSGTSGNEIIIQGEDPDDPPTIAMNAGWAFDCDYRIVQDLFFDSFTDDAIDLGITGPPTAATFITIRRCIFRHADECGIRIYYTEDILIEDCWFVDLRKRVAGVDLNATQIGRTSSRVTMKRCVFEDIGSDGIHINASGYYAQNDHLFQDCAFYVHKPYSLLTRYWHDFSTKVSENGVDFKECSDGAVDVVHCLFRGFTTTVVGQDCSGSSGAQASVHYDSDQVRFYRCRFWDGDRGITYSPGGGYTFEGGWVENCVFHDLADRALDLRTCTHGVTVLHCHVSNCTEYLFVHTCGNATVTLRNNYFDGGVYTRVATTNEIVDYNGWDVALGPPAAWVGANDPVIVDDDLNDFLQPEADSDLLGVGFDFGIADDLVEQVRPDPPAIGPFELAEGLEHLVYFDPDQLYLKHDAVNDSGDDLFLVPRPDGEWAICVRVADTDARFRHWDFEANKNLSLEFHVEPARLDMANNDRFVIARLQDGGVTALEVELRYSGGYYIAVSAVDDAAASQYAGTSNGFALGDNGKHKLTITLTCASRAAYHDGACLLYIDDVFKGAATNLDNDSFTPDDLDIGAISGIDATTGGPDDEGHFYLDPIILKLPGAAGSWQRHHPHALRGTAAERAAYDTTLTQSATHWVETDTEDVYVWDGAAWAGPLGAGGAAHNILSATHTDSNAAAVVRGDIITGDATPEWSRVALGAAAHVLRVNVGGTDIAWEAEFDAVVPTTIQADDAAAAGVAVVAAHRDHAHGFPTVTPVETGTANAEGILYDFVRCDHVHKLHDHLHAGVAGDGAQLDHGNAMIPASLGDDDHPQYLLEDGSRDLTGDMNIDDGLGNSPMLYWVGGAGGSGYIYFMDTPNTLAIYIMNNVAQGWTIRDKGSPEEYLTVVSTDGAREVVVNEDGDQYIDFRVEGVGETHLIFADASAAFVGIGTAGPGSKLDVDGSIRADRLGLNANEPSTDGAIALAETADPASVAGVGMVYAKNMAGFTHFFMERDDSDVLEIAPVVDGVTKTVRAVGGDFTTILSAIAWFQGAVLFGNNVIDCDAGSYDEAVLFENILLAPGATLKLEGDGRALVGLTFADGVNINAESMANGGSGVGALANAGNVVTVTGTIANPSFSLGGIVNGDKVLIFDNTGTTAEYTVSATLNNTITLTVAAPNVGNDSTSITLLADRRIERTAAGPCISADGVRGVELEGWHLVSSTGALCNGLSIANGATVTISHLSAICEDYGFYVDARSYLYGTVAMSVVGTPYGLGVAGSSAAYITYMIVIDGTIGILCQDLSNAFVRYGMALNMATFGFYSYYNANMDAVSCWARQVTNTGYYTASRAYMYATSTNANNNGNGADYSAATDVLHNNNSSITWN